MITVSEGARRRIQKLVEERGGAGGLRVGVKGGGCSGFSYLVDWSDAPGPHDEVIEEGGARVFVDRRSEPFLAGATLDWKSSLLQSGFVFVNPNAKSACGCGESFAV